MNELDRFGSQVNLSKELKESATHIYRKIAIRKLTRGRSIEAMIIASIYAACRINNIPKTIDDFIEFATIEKKTVSQCYRVILTELKIKIPPATPQTYVARLCADLSINGESQKLAFNLLDLGEKCRIFCGKSPQGLAGAAVYLACTYFNERRSQSEISGIINVTEATIRKRYREFLNNPIISKFLKEYDLGKNN